MTAIKILNTNLSPTKHLFTLTLSITRQYSAMCIFEIFCTDGSNYQLMDVEAVQIVQKYSYEIRKQKSIKKVHKRCEDKSIRIFSYDKNKMIKRLKTGINDSISCLGLYKNDFIVAISQDGAVKFWNKRMYKLGIDEQSHRTKYNEEFWVDYK